MIEEKELQKLIDELFQKVNSKKAFEFYKNKLNKEFQNLYFICNNNFTFSYKLKPLLFFKDIITMRSFLNKEKELAINTQNFEHAAYIRDLINIPQIVSEIDYFYLKYSIVKSNNLLKIFFTTNSLIFKFGVIGK